MANAMSTEPLLNTDKIGRLDRMARGLANSIIDRTAQLEEANRQIEKAQRQLDLLKRDGADIESCLSDRIEAYNVLTEKLAELAPNGNYKPWPQPTPTT